MYLTHIDDFALVDYGIPKALITDRSESGSFTVERKAGGEGSVYLRGTPDPAVWNVLLEPPDEDARDAMLAALTQRGQRRLRAERLDAGRTVVEILAGLASIQIHDDLTRFVELESVSSLWRSVTTDTTTKTFANVLDRAVRPTVRGNALTYPIVTLAPVAQRTSFTQYAGWKYRTRYSITNNADRPLVNRSRRLSLGSTTALVSGSKALASGNDVRLVVNGIEQARNLVTWNSGASYLWWVIPLLQPGETLVYDVIYGNPSAGTPPTLAFPTLPSLDLASSSNTTWSWPVSQILGNAGLGAWHLNRTSPPATPDYSTPSSWQPVRTIKNPDNTDVSFVEAFEDNGVSAWAIFKSYRVSGEADVTDPEVIAKQNPYDGVALSSPLPITSVTANFTFTNKDSRGRLSYLERDNDGDDWREFYFDTTVHGTPATATPGAKALDAGMHHLAIALLPSNAWEMKSTKTEANFAEIFWKDTLTVSFDDSAIAEATVQSEVEIYELAARLTIGTADAPPYYALDIGNATQETGAGTPRALVALTEKLRIDCEEHTHRVYSGLVAVEPMSAHAVRGVFGWAGLDATEEHGTGDWLPLVPPRHVVPNGAFGSGITGWVADPQGDTGSITGVLSYDTTTAVGTQLGALKDTISASALNAVNRTLSLARIPVGDRDAVPVAATVRTSNANLVPVLALSFFDASGTFIQRTTEGTWTPPINTPLRRLFSAAVPPLAASYSVGLGVLATAGSATGSVFFDDVTSDDSEVGVITEAVGQLAVTVAVRGAWQG